MPSLITSLSGSLLADLVVNDPTPPLMRNIDQLIIDLFSVTACDLPLACYQGNIHAMPEWYLPQGRHYLQDIR